MKNNIVKGIIGNGLAQITLKVIRVMEQLLLIPFFLAAWGAAYYGEWITLSIIPTVLTFTNFGFGSAVSNSFVLAYTGGNKQKAADILTDKMPYITDQTDPSKLPLQNQIQSQAPDQERPPST